MKMLSCLTDSARAYYAKVHIYRIQSLYLERPIETIFMFLTDLDIQGLRAIGSNTCRTGRNKIPFSSHENFDIFHA